MANNIMDLFPVAVKQITPLVNILDAIEKGPSTGPSTFNKLMDKTYGILSIVQIGAGGTGGYVAAEIMKILGGLPLKVKEHIYYTIVDGDAFEEKNLGRQLCTEDDIGINKAVSLVDNFAEIYDNLDGHVRAYPHYLESMEDLESIKACIVKPVCKPVMIKNTVKEEDAEFNYVIGRTLDDVNNGRDLFTEADIKAINVGAKVSRLDQPDSMVYIYDVTTDTKEFRDVVKALSECGDDNDDSDFTRMAEYNSNAKLYTIIIDCVDKTTPRKVIHDWLETQYTLPHPLEATIMSDRPNNAKMDSPTDVKWDKGTGEVTDLSCKFNVYKEKQQCDNIRSSRDMYLKSDTSFAQGFVARESFKYFTGVEDTYIISSGNGKYTGQVYWGRYSRIIPSARPTRFADFGVCDQGMSTILSSKNPAAVLEKLTKNNANISSNVSFWTSEEGGGKFVWNLAERAYEADVWYHMGYAPDDNGLVAVEKIEHAGSRSLLNLPYEWNEKKHNYVIDVNHPTISNQDAYMSAFMSVPSPYNRHPDLIDVTKDAKEDQMSCAERAAENVQNIAANKTAANLVVNYFRQILNGMFPLEKDSVRLMETVGVQFDVRTNTFKPEVLTKTYLKTYDTFNLWASGRDKLVDNDKEGVIKND